MREVNDAKCRGKSGVETPHSKPLPRFTRPLEIPPGSGVRRFYAAFEWFVARKEN